MHVGFIMDGNRRWARKHQLEAMLGHGSGGDIVEDVVEWCLNEGIETMSLWVLSHANILKRDKKELAHIYSLLETRIPKLVPRLIEQGVRLGTIGDRSLLPESVCRVLYDAAWATKDGTKMRCILAIGYGGRDEIIRGMWQLLSYYTSMSSMKTLREAVKNLDEEYFRRYLDSGSYPDPDLIIRTGGDMRTSGYLLYGSEYAEYAFTETLWPDFSEEEFRTILANYHERQRNFGK